MDKKLYWTLILLFLTIAIARWAMKRYFNADLKGES